MRERRGVRVERRPLPCATVRVFSKEPGRCIDGGCGARSYLSYSTQVTTRRRGMIKVSVMYPNTPGARFNHEYYRDKHMPLVKARMGESFQAGFGPHAQERSWPTYRTT